MAQTFGVNVRTVNEHLQNIFKTKELDEISTVRKFRTVQKEGKRKVERISNILLLFSDILLKYSNHWLGFFTSDYEY